MTQTAIESLKRDSLPQQVAEQLRRAFISGLLLPGTRLVETDIAQQLGVSRNPLREALRILQSEGLVEVQHNRGTYVAQITREDIEEIYSLRKLLEVYAVSQVARQATADQVAELESLVVQMEKATAIGDYRQAANLDLELHKTLWALSGHKRLFNILSGVQTQIRMFLTVNTQLYENLVTVAVADHQLIAEAIRAHDEVEAANLMSHHIELALQETLDFFRRRSIGPANPSGENLLNFNEQSPVVDSSDSN